MSRQLLAPQPPCRPIADDEHVSLLSELLGASFDVDRSGGDAERLPGAVIGEIAGLDASSRPMVRLEQPPRTVAVDYSTVPLAQLVPGAQVVLVFQHGDPARPIVVGVLQSLAPEDLTAKEVNLQPTQHTPATELPIVAIADDERIVIQAQKEIVLQCGKASITLTRAGKVLLRGAYVSSRSSGVNRIKGGSVQIN